MLSRFANIFNPTPHAAPDRTMRMSLATCVLLLEAARADEVVTDAERRQILSVMQTRFGLAPLESEELLREAMSAREESSDLWKFTRAINDGYSHQEKIEVVEEVWRVLLSDDDLHGLEDHLVHKLQSLLNLNHPQLIEAKMRVLEERRS
jgi:uncharacterized tellurite resistance protein B-like protein